MAATLISILMLAGIALVLGGIHLILRRRDRKRGVLMLVAAAVMFGNVAIWLAPMPSAAPAGEYPAGTASPKD